VLNELLATALEPEDISLLQRWCGGDRRVLDILNDGKSNNQVILAKKGNYSGQLWKITPNDKGYYRLTTQWRGDEYSLDVYNNEGSKSKSLVLAPSGEFSGQYWKITKSSGR